MAWLADEFARRHSPAGLVQGCRCLRRSIPGDAHIRRATLIHNPSAGDERPKGADLEKIIEAAGFQVRYQSTKKDWKKALKREADLIVVAGGDGTVAKVLKAVAGGHIPVALLPVGTANNVGRSLGISGDAREIVEEWRTARPRPYDLGIVDSAGSMDHEPFVEACGGGLFAEAIARGKEDVEQATAFVGNEIDRALALLRTLLTKAEPHKWKVEVDGKDCSGDYLAVEVMNIRFVGPSIPLAPAAIPGDGKLDVVMIGESERGGLLDYIERRLAHDDAELPELPSRRGVSIRLRGPSGPVRVDDDLHYGLKRELEVQLRAGAVQILAAGERRASTRRSTSGDGATAPPRSSGKSGPASGKANGRARNAQRS